MAVKLNNIAFENAKRLIREKSFVSDERDDWSEHQPTTDQENKFIEKEGIEEYKKWFLGVDDEIGEDNKTRYKFPFGDFKKVHLCGVLSAESRAGQYKHEDIENALAHLHGMMEK